MINAFRRRFFIKTLTIIFITAVCFTSSGCLSRDKTSKSPDGYDLHHPIVVKLPTELDEISGLAYYPKDNCVFAITDESGLLYKIFLNNPRQIEKWEFGNAADYEDLVLLDSNFYVLISKGHILSFRYLSSDTLARREYILPGKKNEFEILYYDDRLKKLVMMCKDCEGDKKGFLTAFTFDPKTLLFDDRFVIDVKLIATMIDEDKIKFKPSAAAINPVTGELFIVSSINKLLVVTDRNGKAKQVFGLNGMFKQPEGITFTPNGTMIISNEAAGEGVANLLIFPYKKTADQNK